jgi:hypothetical protein
MRKRLMLALTILVFGHAQTVEPTVSNVKISEYQPVFECIRLVSGLWQMQQRSGLTFSQDQATELLLHLNDLYSETDLLPDRANKTRVMLESLLAPEQMTWWEALKQAQERLFKMRSAQIRTIEPFSIYNVVVPGYPLIRKSLEKGEPFNPFQQSPNSEILNNLATALKSE